MRLDSPEQIGGIGHVTNPAALADPPHEPLREDAAQDGGEEIGLDTHILKTGDRSRRVIGVERGEHQVARQGRMDGDLRRLEIADLADHDDVRILPDDGAQSAGERQSDLRPDGDLVDPFELVFHGIFDRDDLLLRHIDLVERGVEGGRLPRTRGPGDEDDAVGLVDEAVED